MRSALLASTAFSQAMFSCARNVRDIRLIVVIFTAVFFISTHEVPAEPVQNQTINATVYGTATYVGGAPVKFGTLYVTIVDQVANTTRQVTMATNDAGQYTISSSFTCSSSTNSISFGFGFRGLLEDGRLQPVGAYEGGSRYCPNGDHPPQELPLLFSGPAGNYAGPMCPAPGKPVNPTNGNMWVNQNDYTLPGGAANGINLTRTYNSITPTHGYFGFGWKSDFDERVYFHPNSGSDTSILNYGAPDGRLYHFERTGNSGFNHFYAPFTADATGQIVWYANAPSTFTFTEKNGRVSNYEGSSGKILWTKDRNGNQTTYNYDPTFGRLTGVTDAFGRTLTITVNPVTGVITQISDALGLVATYEYEDYPTNTPQYRLLKTVTYADGSKRKFEYQIVGGRPYLATVKDAVDNILETHVYDTQGRATTSEIHGAAEKYTLDYTNTNLNTNPHTIVTDGLGRVTKYYFDRSKGKSLVTKTEGLCGCGGSGSENTLFEYDNKWNVSKKTDALNRETNYTYDSNRNVTSIQDVLGTQTFTYNSFGEVLKYRDRVDSQNPDPNVTTVTNTFDTNGNLLTSKDALGNITTLAYPTTNNKGLPDSIKDARNNITKFKWFTTSGMLEEVEDPYGKKTNFTYEPRGRIDTITNALGHVTDYNYFDDAQRKVEMIYPNLDKITYKFDSRRLPESTTDERGKVTTYEFDPQYRLKKITDPLGHFKQFCYDTMSNLTAQADALGNVTNYEYDDFDRLKKVRYPSPTSSPPPVACATPTPDPTRLEEKFEYDKTGRIKKITDTAIRDTLYVYDDVTRKITITNAELEATELKYNQRLQMTEVKDAINQVYTFAYDPLGRVLSQTRAGESMSFTYDPVGNRKTRTDAFGRLTNYTYDNLNRLTTIEYGTPTGQQSPVTYGYDFISRLTSATNEMGTVTFGYDNRNRMTSTTDVFGHVVAYEYDRTSTVNQRRLKLDGSLYATYNYDNAERLQNIVNVSDNTTIGYTYFNDDTVQTRTYPNGVSTSYTYDNMRRLTRLTDNGPSGTLFDRQYGYNTANQIGQITEPSLTRIFTYDNVDRLRTVTNGGSGENYIYDHVGNRTSSHLSSTYGYQTGFFNHLTSTQTATYNYDANGNIVSKSAGKDFWRYGFDYENRMYEAATRKQKVRYKYDALGRRVSRNLGYGKEKTKFTYDGLDVLVDDNAGTLTKYLNGEGIDNKLRQTNGSTASYFLADHLGSTNGLLNSSGALTSSNSYDSFGNPTNPSFSSRYQFTGREFDSFSGLQYSRARFYDPNLGRFISEDPIGLGGGINQYSYVRNNAVNKVDPFGLYEIDVHYYLTYYLARQNGCFTEIDAQYIAFSTQYVDDNPDTRPAWGGDPRQREVNRENHALHPGNHDMYMKKRWQGTNSGSWPSQLSALGSTLHYQQDTYSHSGYTNPIWGHLSGTHAVDKTDSDVYKTLAMAQATFKTLNAFSSKHCNCVGIWTQEMSDQIRRFAALPGGNFITRYIDSIENNNPSYLNDKKNALGF